MIVASLMGRFGNSVMTYLFCRALAERTGSELRVEPWAGERVFDLSHSRPDGRKLVRMSATEALAWAEPDYSGNLGESNRRSGGCMDIEVRDYCQFQQAMIYTKRQAQAWLPMRSEITAPCAEAVAADDGLADRIVFHLRAGDYLGYGYPVVSQNSYGYACGQYGLIQSPGFTAILSEDNPTPHCGLLPDDLSFMPDFYRMMTAPTLLRANSSFSWLAALLGNGLVLAPVIDGLEGGKEHLCRFVAGNHPRLANFDFTTDLYVNP